MKKPKKFTTVNNWICKQFIQQLCAGNYRSCCLLMYNTFDQLTDDVRIQMFDYLFDAINSFETWMSLYKTLPYCVTSHLSQFYLQHLDLHDFYMKHLNDKQ